MSSDDLSAIFLTLKLASATTILLLIIGPLIAWKLAMNRGKLSYLVEAVVARPLVLPPTVLGFYLLLLFSPNSGPGKFMMAIFGEPLVFSFKGLLIASVIYSLPFVVQPLQAAFRSLDQRLLENMDLLNLSVFDRIFTIIIPLTLPSFMVAILLAFAHTVGEFGVVLMIGGNIPDETRVLSIALFDHVESMNYEAAHELAFGLLAFSLITLFLVYGYFGKKSYQLRWT